MTINDLSDITNVIDVIQSEHQEIEALLARVADRTNGNRSEAFDELSAHLAKHEAAEQAVVRPEIEKIDGAEAASRVAEETKADAMLERLRSMDVGSADFNTLFDKFRGAVLRHAQHEEAEEHPKLEANLDAARLEDMGDEFVQAEEDAP
jgi:hemerythrin superfamily protein